MNEYKSCSELKSLAKTKLDGYYKLCMSALLLQLGVTYICTMIISMLVPGTDTTSDILFMLLTAAVSVILGVLNTGFAYFYLNIFCGTPKVSASIFYAFSNHPEKSVKVSLLYSIIDFICKTPAQYFLLLLIKTKDLTYAKYWLIAFVIGYVIYIPATLFLSQTYYLLVDFPDYTAKDAILTGFKLAKKHFGKLLYLKISFLLLYLLAVLSFGIGLLWIIPYMQMTYTCFYVDIMNPQKTSA